MRQGTLQERHFAVVTDNNDPDKRGRLRVSSQSLTGAGSELPDWVEPLQLYASVGNGASLWVPSIGSTVELIADVEDVGFDQMRAERFLQNPTIRWTSAPPTLASGAMPLPAQFTNNYPQRRGFVTPTGLAVIFDDADGVLLLQDSAGNEIKITKGGDIYSKSPSKIVHVSPVHIGEGATERMMLGDAFMALYNVHTHPTGIGPTGAPTQQMSGTQLSQQGNLVR